MSQVYINQSDKTLATKLHNTIEKKLYERKDLKAKHGADRVSDHVSVMIHWNDWIDILELLKKIKS